MNYKLSFALGLIAPGTVGREPVAYLYNGVVLPKLPEWDRETYPYAMIRCSQTDSAKYMLEVSASAIAFDALPAEGVRIDPPSAQYATRDDGWELSSMRETAEYFFNNDTIRWTNHDFFYADGTLYLAASDPVPVYA